MVSSASRVRAEGAGGALAQRRRRRRLPEPARGLRRRGAPASARVRPRPIAVGGAAVVGGGVALATSGSERRKAPTTTVPPPDDPAAGGDHDHDHHHHHHRRAGASTRSSRRLQGLDARDGRHRHRHGAARARLRHVRVDGPLPDRATASRWTACRRVDRCRSTITFTTSGATRADVGVAGCAARRPPARYDVRMTIRSEGPNNAPKADRRLTVTVSPPAGAAARRHPGAGGEPDEARRPGASTRAPTPTPSTSRRSASDATTGQQRCRLRRVQGQLPRARPARSSAR